MHSLHFDSLAWVVCFLCRASTSFFLARICGIFNIYAFRRNAQIIFTWNAFAFMITYIFFSILSYPHHFFKTFHSDCIVHLTFSFGAFRNSTPMLFFPSSTWFCAQENATTFFTLLLSFEWTDTWKQFPSY